MPGPAAPLAIPLLFGPAALGGAKMAATTFAREYGTTLTSFSLATVFARQAWKQVPSWMKEDEAFRSMVNAADNNKESDVSEVLSLTAVVEKLQKLVSYGIEKVQEDNPDSFDSTKKFHFQTTFLCYLQLAIQLRLKYPEISQSLYRCCSDRLNNNNENDNDGFDNDNNINNTDDNKMNKQLSLQKGIDDGNNNNEVVAVQENWEELRRYLTFAIYAYEVDTDKLRNKLEAEDFYLLHHGKTTKMPPGFVGHFTAVSPERKIILIGVKGTSTIEDLITDCCGHATPFEMEQTPFVDDNYETVKRNIDILYDKNNNNKTQTTTSEEDNGSSKSKNKKNRRRKKNSKKTSSQQQQQHHEEADMSVELQYFEGIKIRCHEGILIAAKQLVTDKLLETVRQTTQNCGYDLVLCGHSLGAGTACLMALIFQSRFPHLKLHVYTYGCPPVLDREAALACAPFTTSVVCGADLITRSSLSNLRALLYFLRVVQTEYMEPNLLSPPTNIPRLVRLIQKLSQGSETDLLMTKEQHFKEINEAQNRIFGGAAGDDHHLYVPGRVLLFYKTTKTKEDNNTATASYNKEEKEEYTTTTKPEQHGNNNKQNDENKNSNNFTKSDSWEIIERTSMVEDKESSTTEESSSIQYTVTNGTTKVLRLFDIGSGVQMFTDHLTLSYTECIEAMMMPKI